MRKEIISLIIGVGLVYAQSVVAKDRDMNRDIHKKATSSYAQTQKVSDKKASKNYYKHEKRATGKVQQDQYIQTDGERAYIPDATGTSLKANQKFINNVESDLQQMRNHR